MIRNLVVEEEEVAAMVGEEEEVAAMVEEEEEEEAAVAEVGRMPHEVEEEEDKSAFVEFYSKFVVKIYCCVLPLHN